MWDQGHKGYITMEELRRILQDVFSVEDEQCEEVFKDGDCVDPVDMSRNIYFSKYAELTPW
jgi:Ca2+-binding EF-hand superfamily protein